MPTVYAGPLNFGSMWPRRVRGRGFKHTRGDPPPMALGYDGKLYILAFDHRGSFQKKMFGIEGDPSDEETAQISDAKHLIFEGMLKAAEEGAKPGVSGWLDDEKFGEPKGIPRQARERGLVLSI